jgi:hypothetical protein
MRGHAGLNQRFLELELPEMEITATSHDLFYMDRASACVCQSLH